MFFFRGKYVEGTQNTPFWRSERSTLLVCLIHIFDLYIFEKTQCHNVALGVSGHLRVIIFFCLSRPAATWHLRQQETKSRCWEKPCDDPEMTHRETTCKFDSFPTWFSPVSHPIDPIDPPFPTSSLRFVTSSLRHFAFRMWSENVISETTRGATGSPC